MSSASYGQPSPMGMSLPHDFRQRGSFPSFDHPVRRRSPSPSPPARRHPYDSYKPAPYREDHVNSYWPNVWRPERYRSRSPSPPRYERSRMQDFRHWDNVSRWHPTYHHDRRSPPSPPSWDKGRRDTIGERMFEPSDIWRQSHVDRPARYDSQDYASDRYGDRRPPILPREFSPRRAGVRSGFTQFSGDSYRPCSGNLRDSGLVARADTYRPHYSDDSWRSYPGDVTYQSRLSGYHDREDDRPLSSIASTPPRQGVRSPSPTRTFARVGSSYRAPLGRSSIVYDYQRSYTPSSSRSRRSSLSEQPPLKKHKSRSSSGTSRDSRQEKPVISELNEVSVLPRSPIDAGGAAVQTMSPPHVPNDVCPLSSDQKVLSKCPSNSGIVGVSIDTLRDHETMHVNECRVTPTMDLDPGPHLTEASESAPVHNDTPSKGTLVGAVGHQAEQASIVLPSCEVPQLQDPLPGTQSTLALESVASLESGPANDLFSPNGVGDDPWSPSSSTVTPSAVSGSLEKEPEVGPSPMCHEVDVNRQTENIITAEPIVNSLQIVISDHSTSPVSKRSEHSDTCEHSASTDSKSIRDGLRLVVLTRIRCDRQTRAERVFPVVRANQVVSSLNNAPSRLERQSDLFQEAESNLQFCGRMDTHSTTRTSLVDRFVKRQSEILEKTKRLKEEYLTLHERWLEHCARLDECQKNGVSEETALPTGGRATRRSTAMMGDAVRSDLEMEQIIASLGVEELTDPSYLAVKNVAKIPDMISVTHGSVPLLFDDTNNLVENPAEFYSGSSGHDYWTEEERDIFLTEFAAHPKQFGLIADRLPNKSVAQCITYYYLHKKQGVDFRKAVMQYGSGRRRKNGKGANKRKGNALLTDIRRHDDEVSRESSGLSVPSGGSIAGKRKREILRVNGDSRKSTTPRRATARVEATPTSSGTTPDPDADQQKRKRRGATVASARATAVTTDGVVGDIVVPDSDRKSVKKGRRVRKSRGPSATTPSEEPGTPVPVVEPSPDEQLETGTQRKSSSLKTWSGDDKSCFISLLAQYGDDFKRIAASMPNKTTVQVSNYYRSNVRELGLESVAALAPKRSPTPKHDRGPSFRSGGMCPAQSIDTMSSDSAAGVVTLPQVTESLSSRRLQIGDLLNAPSGPGFQSSLPVASAFPLSYTHTQHSPLWSHPSQAGPPTEPIRSSADPLFPVLGDFNFTCVSHVKDGHPKPYPANLMYRHFA